MKLSIWWSLNYYFYLMFESLVAVFHMIIDIVDRKQQKGIKKNNPPKLSNGEVNIPHIYHA